MKNASTPITLLVMLALIILGFYIDTSRRMVKAGRVARRMWDNREEGDIKLALTYPIDYIKSFYIDG